MTDAVTILDDSSPGPFEGPEKLLELWFAPSQDLVPASKAHTGQDLRPSRDDATEWTGLRQVARHVWDDMLDEVKCKVLSVIEGEQVDAYLLSESSMFVWPHKLILKTCGTTTTLLGLPTLLRIASETCGFRGVWRCFYSRKTFMFPDRQIGPHKDWAQEMSFLDTLFENSSAYTVGRMNGDHWLLYLTPPQDDVLMPHALETTSALSPINPTTALSTLSASLSASLPSPTLSSTSPRSNPFSSIPSLLKDPTPPSVPSIPDQTLEILMTRLSPRACASFYHPGSSADTPYTSYPDIAPEGDAHSLGTSLSTQLGITSLLPDATLDAFLFSPCGFSSNAVRGERYATIHVTPEPAYSYASFETNLDLSLSPSDVESSSASLQKLVERVLTIFEPATLSITLFVSIDDDDEVTKASQHEGMRKLMSEELARRYERKDRILYEFEGYSLIYSVYNSVDEPSRQVENK
ncbi:BZ3500_MvSof-1268-A1-R1_Chr3-2g06290 [Microbotryum saponariae]|uniref:BZ3500_MvSof-1268-A1-R1_Chr3-2g06290 protein n=1 Tax=Microbotryum saponariae TaxID=289078 RepID=A0A2X0MZK6_9BASI|nr:BZ3500_MvSof-1268-A1-R1_Chr3-2g06290 [Microbotryum saponariae]SDA04261.1 BZ3501_MvSof-1269-A2-R1_Chr3-2g05981 [Microbotryum saponariae]